MRKSAILLSALLAVSLLSGCVPAVVVTSPKNEAFRKDWDEAMEELKRDLQEDLEDEEEGPWSAWAREWEAWGEGAGEDVVTMQIRGGLEELSLFPGVEMEDVLTFHVSVPAETAEALRDPAGFSE